MIHACILPGSGANVHIMRSPDAGCEPDAGGYELDWAIRGPEGPPGPQGPPGDAGGGDQSRAAGDPPARPSAPRAFSPRLDKKTANKLALKNTTGNDGFELVQPVTDMDDLICCDDVAGYEPARKYPYALAVPAGKYTVVATGMLTLSRLKNFGSPDYNRAHCKLWAGGKESNPKVEAWSYAIGNLRPSQGHHAHDGSVALTVTVRLVAPSLIVLDCWPEEGDIVVLRHARILATQVDNISSTVAKPPAGTLVQGGGR